MLSSIQVRDHRFSEISILTRKDASQDELDNPSITCQHQLSYQQREHDSAFWLVRLKVKMIDPEEGPRSVYTGSIEVVGEFEIHPDLKEDDKLKLVAANGGAVLYGSIREWVSIMSARCINGMIELPTIDPRSFIPKAEELVKK